MKTSSSTNEDFEEKIGCSPIWSSSAATELGKVRRKDQMKIKHLIKHFSACET